MTNFTTFFLLLLLLLLLLLRFIFLNIIKEKVRSKLFPIDLYLFTGQFEI